MAERSQGAEGFAAGGVLLGRYRLERVIATGASCDVWRAADTFKDRAELEEMFLRSQCPWMLWDSQRVSSR